MKLLVFISFTLFFNQICCQDPWSGLTFGECAKEPIITNFDANRYLGTWFEIQRIDYLFEEANLQCLFAQYGRINDTFVSVKNTGVNM